jgi:hypothetical protein
MFGDQRQVLDTRTFCDDPERVQPSPGEQTNCAGWPAALCTIGGSPLFRFLCSFTFDADGGVQPKDGLYEFGNLCQGSWYQAKISVQPKLPAHTHTHPEIKPVCGFQAYGISRCALCVGEYVVCVAVLFSTGSHALWQEAAPRYCLRRCRHPSGCLKHCKHMVHRSCVWTVIDGHVCGLSCVYGCFYLLCSLWSCVLTVMCCVIDCEW